MRRACNDTTVKFRNPFCKTMQPRQSFNKRFYGRKKISLIKNQLNYEVHMKYKTQEISL
jgi:hypothetical protein